jgi:hypothetical protein
MSSIYDEAAASVSLDGETQFEMPLPGSLPFETNKTQAGSAVGECPECGLHFPTPQGMGAHRKAKHGVIGRVKKAPSFKQPRVACPDCGLTYSKKDLPRHQRAMHKAEIPMRRGKAAKTHDHDITTPGPQTHSVDELLDDFFTSALSILWPLGEVPVAAMNDLIKWREATKVMLTNTRTHE